MSLEISTRITISAGQREVWATLVDFAAYPAWNPFILRIEGPCELGARLRTTLRLPSGKTQSFTPTVTACEPERVFQWRGALAGMPWLFSGVHRFELHAAAPGVTELVHSESFGGLFASPILALIRKDTVRGFEAMNLALKERLEAHLQI